MNMRHAGRDELRTCAVFLDDCWRDAYRHILPEEYLRNMSPERRHENFIKQYDTDSAEFLVMTDDERLIGVAVYGKSITEGFEDDGEISAIYLHKDYIGKGYGHDLFVKTEQLLGDKGYTHFVVDVFTDNKRAVEFYIKHGYDKVAERTIRLGENDYPLLVLRK